MQEVSERVCTGKHLIYFQFMLHKNKGMLFNPILQFATKKVQENKKGWKWMT
jgi:hypothetical protein